MKHNQLLKISFLTILSFLCLLTVQAQQGNKGGNKGGDSRNNSRTEVKNTGSSGNKKSSQQQGRSVGSVSKKQVTYKKQETKAPAYRTTPQNTRQVTHQNHTYHYSDGRFYTHSGGKYVRVAPVIGLVIDLLPTASINISLGGASLQYYEGVFYSGGNGRYQVAQPQIGMIVDALPVDYEKVVVDGIIYYEYNNVLYTRVSTVNGKGYQVVGFIS